MSDGLRIGVQLPEVERITPWSEYLAMARAAEEVGFDSIWLGDHLLYRDDGREERGPWDAWTLLAALAAATERVQLGPLVGCTAFSPPGQIARRAAAIQEVSDGRFVLGLGAGWNETEFRAFGLPLDHRASRFAESFEIIRRLLDGERVSFAGHYERADDAVLLPRPSSRPPLMIGSLGERVLRMTLPHVDGWNVWCDWFANTPEGFARENARITRILTEVGRDPTEVYRSATVFVTLAGGHVDRPHANPMELITSPPDQIASRLLQFQEVGLDEAILVLNPITEASIRALADVVSAVKG